MLPGVPILVFTTNGTLHLEDIFCFVHDLIQNIAILKIYFHTIISWSYADILA